MQRAVISVVIQGKNRGCTILRCIGKPDIGYAAYHFDKSIEGLVRTEQWQGIKHLCLFESDSRIIGILVGHILNGYDAEVPQMFLGCDKQLDSVVLIGGDGQLIRPNGQLVQEIRGFPYRQGACRPVCDVA